MSSEDSISGSTIAHDKVTPDSEEGTIDLVNVISAYDDREQEEFEPLFGRVDHLVESLFSDPPSPDAQVEMSFTYEGYRVNLDQSGHLRLMQIR